jgi:hypothetical protein
VVRSKYLLETSLQVSLAGIVDSILTEGGVGVADQCSGVFAVAGLGAGPGQQAKTEVEGVSGGEPIGDSGDRNEVGNRAGTAETEECETPHEVEPHLIEVGGRTDLRSAGAICSGADSYNFVEPSMSVNTNVTVPDGPATATALHINPTDHDRLTTTRWIRGLRPTSARGSRGGEHSGPGRHGPPGPECG